MEKKGIILIFLFLLYGFAGAQSSSETVLGSPIETLIKSNPDQAFVDIKKQLDHAVKKGDSIAAATCYHNLGLLFYQQAAYLRSVNYYYKADHIYRKSDDHLQLAKNLNRLGQAYYYSKQYHIALTKFREALNIYTRLNNRPGRAASYGLIGQAYEKNLDYKRAMQYQRLALKEYNFVKDPAGVAKIYENLGSIYEDEPQMDSALTYYTRALQLNKASANEPAQIEILNNIGDVYRKTGHFNKALTYTRDAARLSLELSDQYQLSSAYRDISKNYARMKRYDSAYHYSELGRNIFLDIFTEDSNKQLTLLQTLFEIQQKDEAILRFENQQNTNRLIIIAAVLIVVLLISLAFSIISRQRLKLKNEKESNEQNQALYRVQKQAMEADLEVKSKELTSHTLHLIQKNQLLEELSTKLSDMVKDDKRDQRRELKQLLGLINQNNNHDKNWDDFRIVFERVHENFFDRLKKYTNSLTASELRLVALLKMNLSSADISTMLGISQDSLRTSRYRLRKKLNLQEGENLSTFIQGL